MKSNKISEIAISLKNVKKTYRIRESSSETLKGFIFSLLGTRSKLREIHALENINLEIEKGEIFGIIGHNGSGKSTLLNIMINAIPCEKGGHVQLHGKALKLTLGMGIDPNLSARDNIYINASILGLRFKEIGEVFFEIIELAGLEEFIDTPVKYYSKGMRARLKFAIAMHARADIFLLDEFFGGVGDANFKEKSKALFEESIIRGKTIVIVSHTMGLIKKFCSRVLWLENGKIRTIDTPKNIIGEYKKAMKTNSRAKR